MALERRNPFCEMAYGRAMRANGSEPWILGVLVEGNLVSGCYGFLSQGRLNRLLSIPSLPNVVAGEREFWNGLTEFCRAHQVSHLSLSTCASAGSRIPLLPGEIARNSSFEYVLQLEDAGWERNVARNHRQSIALAGREGLQLRRIQTADACRDHVRLMCATIDRRRRRGENTPTDVEEELPWLETMLEERVGELFQAVREGEVLSSAMIMRASEGAYNQSAGTSPAGMLCGASHFLISRTAAALRQESAKLFNLGGAEPNSGLARFKERFGATAVPREDAEFSVGSRLRGKLSAGIRLLRRVTADVRRRASTGGR